MVGVEGFEPPTTWSQTRYATRLRYTPKVGNYTAIPFLVNAKLNQIKFKYVFQIVLIFEIVIVKLCFFSTSKYYLNFFLI